LIKRETVILLKEQYVTVALIWQTMFFSEFFVIAYCKKPV